MSSKTIRATTKPNISFSESLNKPSACHHGELWSEGTNKSYVSAFCGSHHNMPKKTKTYNLKFFFVHQNSLCSWYWMWKCAYRRTKKTPTKAAVGRMEAQLMDRLKTSSSSFSSSQAHQDGDEYNKRSILVGYANAVRLPFKLFHVVSRSSWFSCRVSEFWSLVPEIMTWQSAPHVCVCLFEHLREAGMREAVIDGVPDLRACQDTLTAENRWRNIGHERAWMWHSKAPFEVSNRESEVENV